MTPGDVGLPVGHRRRTPGLRRSELATLAGISVEYLTRLEQGRDTNPSVQVLAALCDALRLTPAERTHVRFLWKLGGGGEVLCAATQPPAQDVRSTVRALLASLEPSPAVLLNRLSDVVAYTQGYENLAGPLGVLDSPSPNLLRYVLTDHRSHDAFPDWERRADHAVDRLRTIAPADRHTAELIEELTVTAGGPFLRRMSGLPAVPRPTGVERWHRPEVGDIRLAFETLDLPEDDFLQLVVLLPADEAAATALDHLNGRRPGRLHAVVS